MTRAAPVVLVVGSLHHDIMIKADHLPGRDETAVGQSWSPKFGGKGGNQAVAAARAGVACRMVGAVGHDGFGAFLLDALDRAGVDRSPVQVIADAGSGISVAIEDAQGDYAATIVSGANLLLDGRVLEGQTLWDGVRVLVLQNEVPEPLNLLAAHHARHRGIPVVLNAAPARALSPDFCRSVDWLVVNAVEAAMMGAPPVVDLDAALAAARHIVRDFPGVIVTAGGHGLAAATKAGSSFCVPAQQVTVTSTHGAGDCFVGTFAAALSLGDPPDTACRHASAVAAAHVSGQVYVSTAGR
jgi:ribokinase